MSISLISVVDDTPKKPVAFAGSERVWVPRALRR
jgi:hypothetical protein